MKCISLWQPWASAIAVGLKKIETRDWSTNVRGRIAIHAAKRWTRDEKEFTAARRRALDPLPDPMPLGAIVATAVLVEVRSTESWIASGISDIEQMYGYYGPGRFGWALDDVISFAEPISINGRQGFFTVPDDLFTDAQRREPPPRQCEWPFPVSTIYNTDGSRKGAA